jgi:hypothetical protein
VQCCPRVRDEARARTDVPRDLGAVEDDVQQRFQRRRQRAHGRSRAQAAAACLALLSPLALSASCSDDDAPKPAPGADAGARQPAAKLVYRKVPGTPLKIKVPDGWALEEVEPGPEPKGPGADGGPTKPGGGTELTLASRTMMSARAPSSKVNDKLAAWLIVLHDPFLPQGTTSSAYLEAQRKSNATALPSLEHVEAESSRRQGRPSYYVRDEWKAPLTKDKSIAFSQESLLLLDAQEESLHGYSVTITLPKEDRGDLAGTLREMLDSVRFEKRR